MTTTDTIDLDVTWTLSPETKGKDKKPPTVIGSADFSYDINGDGAPERPEEALLAELYLDTVRRTVVPFCG